MGSSSAIADQREPGVIGGVDLGVSIPTSKHFYHRVDEGAAAIPYVGYMFSDWIGLQFSLLGAFQTPDDWIASQEWTTMLGYLVGPRVEIPFADMGVPQMDLYGIAQGGGFSGLSGTLTQTDPGMSFGGGLDYYLTDEMALTLFGRWNRIVGGARPNSIIPPNPPIYSSPPDEGPVDFTTFGIGVKFDFREPAAPPPPPPTPVRKAEAAPAPPVKKRLILRGVNFDFDKSNIRPQDVPVLEEAVRTLKAEGLPTVVATGYTDSVGSDAYNDKLSMRRADSVRNWLVEHGIPRNKIVAEGKGERDPVATNETADGRAQNRRTELRIRE
jgi:outer membrane protein OmpA-like peptidoglycan-associated protein